MFEPVPESETDDEKSVACDTDYDVEVYSEKDIHVYRGLSDDAQFKTNNNIVSTKLTLWWPSAAKQIANAFYSDKETKRAAIKTLMNLFEYKHVDVSILKLPTEPLIELRKLYDEKLKAIEKYAIQVKNTWCDILRKCATRCKMLISEKESDVYNLKKKAVDMMNKYKINELITHMIRREYDKSIREIEYVSICRMQLAKSDYKVDEHIQDVCRLYEINTDINNTVNKLMNKKNYDAQIFTEMENAFEQECSNIDFEISKQLQRECQEYWIDALE